MKVALRDMPCHRRVDIPPAFVAEAVAGLPMRVALERPDEDPSAGGGAAEFDLYIEDANVFARGHLNGWVEVACSRCVGPVRVEIDEPLHVTFMPAGRMPDATADDQADKDEGEPGADADADDIDLFPYSGEEIDLAPLLREQVILAVPFAPLCSESCRGLCPVCGIDRNSGSCTCDPAPPDPRWSALKNLKP